MGQKEKKKYEVKAARDRSRYFSQMERYKALIEPGESKEAVKMKPPPYESPCIEAIKKTEIQSLFEAADDNQRLFLCFGFYLAIRVGALVSLKRKNITEIDEEKQTFRLTWIAKGNRRVSKVYTEWDSLPIGWISDMMVMADEEYLFKGRKEKDHIAVRTAQRWMKRLGKACDIQVGLEGESRITPHDLRHSGATIIAEASGGYVI